MRQANVAIMRERHILPTVDEIIHDLNGATVFSKLDLKSGYHQLELEESSRYITTFSTHMGLFRYKRLNFGIVSASEIFQETIRKSIRRVQNAKNLSDDIIVYGKTQAEHDAALHETFEALQRNGLTVNLKKCEFNKEKISFFGVVFQKEGISPDPAKVDAIHKATQPQNVQELRSFLGMTNYSARFIEHYATICEPLRRLTRKDIEWNWGPQQESAFNELKEKLSSETVIRYYNPRDEITIHVDASPVGLGAIMSQNEQTVAYASRSLSDVESRYSQTEREALAIVWACEHFDIFIRGAPNVDIITDHKPLERIWSKARPPLRIERWGLRLQPYKITIKYRPGKDNPADYMSRHPVVTNQRNTHEQKIAEQYVNFIATEAVPKAMTLNEIVTASKEDQTITKAIELVKSGKWHEIKEIADSDINIRLNDQVDKMIGNCIPCQSTTTPKIMEPLKMSEMPSRPWRNLSADFCGPLPSGEYLFVVIDEYLRYPIVEITRSVSANAVIPVLDKIISMFGIPKVIKTDNGSPFNSYQFSQYAQNIGFHHRRITPRWPRANAQAESFNKPLMKNIKASEVEHRNWKQSMYQFLRQYRATPHSSTGITPFHLLFGREA
ncbi:hypothetical protein FSP39_016677 [Pinctada imbricata]|uniref:Integrase catalytic domain-containing protein n=1 Tax=Pinctada imbricata TaxID=66713 RepID=A0AA88YNA1_PINIB|nr:hypothetical protein FSP39_016677 [Pinctada imbricata]